uniref:CASP-like protein n=1 Tax=Nelumbo nucifera TaxID=4432 RepID=A0A822XNR3_NELNU|nr:TPA_asm: hypothetical protein HUJ06_023145 [Nelumbo nucifera]
MTYPLLNSCCIYSQQQQHQRTRMRFPQSSLRNGETPPRTSALPFHSTVSVQKLRLFDMLILVFRLASFSFSLASAVFMTTNSHGFDSPNWHDFNAFRYPPFLSSVLLV